MSPQKIRSMRTTTIALQEYYSSINKPKRRKGRISNSHKFLCNPIKKIKEGDKLIEFKPYGKLVGCRFLKNGVSFIRISLHSITPCSIWHLENSMCIIDMKRKHRKHNFYFIYFILFLFSLFYF